MGAGRALVHFSLNAGLVRTDFPAAARKRVQVSSRRRRRAASSALLAAAPAAPGETSSSTPARHSQSLEIVVTGRADDHGGPEFLERLVAAASHNHALLDRAGIAHTFTLVEWNPVPGRRLLAEAVAERLPFWGRWLRRRSRVARGDLDQPAPPVHGVLRQERGGAALDADAILTTNSDVFLSKALVARLAEAPLEDEHVYRAVRYDVDRHCDWRAGGEAVLADPRHHVRVNQLSAPEFANGAGDFLLLTRATWQRLRGFNETVRFAKIHKDGQFCHRAWIEGLTFDTLGPIWHLDHDGSYSNAGALRGSPDAPYGPEWEWRADYRNPDDWGLLAAIEETDGAGLVRLRHRAGRDPPADDAGSKPAAATRGRSATRCSPHSPTRPRRSRPGSRRSDRATERASRSAGPIGPRRGSRQRPGPPVTSSSACTRPMRGWSARCGAAMSPGLWR